MARGLEACGVRVEEDEDTLIVHGMGPGGVPGGATCATHIDHRIAMSFLVCGLAAKAAVAVDDGVADPDLVPGFRGADAGAWGRDRAGVGRSVTTVVRIGFACEISILGVGVQDLLTGEGVGLKPDLRGRAMIFTVAIDGPAAAGKGTIGRAVAARFGFRHLDTGLLYRAVGAMGGDPVAGRAKPDARGSGPRRPAHAGGGAGGKPGRRDPRGAGGAGRLPAPFCAGRRRRGAGRARHRHGDLPRGRGEAVRHRQPRGPRAPALAGGWRR